MMTKEVKIQSVRWRKEDVGSKDGCKVFRKRKSRDRAHKGFIYYS